MCFLPLSKNNLDQWWRVSKKILKYMDIMLYTFESNKSCEELKVNQSQIKNAFNTFVFMRCSETTT